MIALWGVAQDRPLAAVHRELVRQRRQVVLLDQLAPAAVDVTVTLGDAGVRGRWTDGHVDVDLTRVRAWYARPYDTASVLAARGLPQDAPAARRLVAGQEALSAWWESTAALVVNPPGPMSLNGSKPHQLTHVAVAGFAVPRTLVTNDPVRALEFVRAHERVVYKSVSSVRSKVGVLTDADADRLGDLRWCPTQLQEWVPGDDVRVHVVGTDVFATAIRTGAVDYRYPADGQDTELEATRLPADVADRCRAMAAAMRLPFAGIDLRRTPAGEWFCFEVNPSPGFTFYESATGQPIAAAVARLLAAA